MNRDTERYRSLTRRALALGGVKLGLFGALAGRMYYLQVTEAERYRMLAEDNRINMQLLAPSRGQIVDRFGVPLAVNDQNFRVVLVAEQAGDVEATLARLGEIVPLTEEVGRRVLRDVSRRRAFVPVTVIDNLSWEQVARIEVNSPELPGLSIEVGDLLHYPHEGATAHILGYVGAVNESELTGDPVLTLPGFRIGKTGMERQHDSDLRGGAGTSQVEVNALGRVIRELSRDEGTPGANVQLTIDIGLQAYVQERLISEHSAAAVIMDIETGEILALASTPTFDPNLFTTGISRDNWRRLTGNPYRPLTDKAINGQYAPGSTFKMLVALAALEEGVVGANHRVYCPGHMTLGNHRFHCWRRGGHGWVAMVDAIAQSCDVYFYDLSRRLGVDKIAEMANRFGIGQRTGIDLPGESPGLMPTRAWKQATIGTPWQPGETLVVSIGQGYVLATPLQLCVMAARLVNGGRAVEPHLTLDVRRHGEGLDDDGNAASRPHPTPPSMGLSPHALGVAVEGMVQVTSGPRGTARGSRIREEGLEMGGKTGTSQVRRITVAERMTGIIPNERRPWRDRDHALFVGFAPIHAPRYACAVVVEHGGGGSRIAAPIARDIMLECQRRNPARELPGSDVAAATRTSERG